MFLLFHWGRAIPCLLATVRVQQYKYNSHHASLSTKVKFRFLSTKAISPTVVNQRTVIYLTWTGEEYPTPLLKF